MSDDTPTHDEDELRRQLHRLGTAMDAASAHEPRTVISLDGHGTCHRRPRRLVAAGAVVGAAAALIIGLVVVRSPNHQPLETTRTAGSGSSITAATASTLPTARNVPTIISISDVIGSLMPATSAEYNSGAHTGLWEFAGNAWNHQAAACFASKGWSSAAVAYFADSDDSVNAPSRMDNQQYPDLAKLATGTFLPELGYDVNAAAQQAAMDAVIPKDRQNAANADFRACQPTSGPLVELMRSQPADTNTLAVVQGAFEAKENAMTSDPTYLVAFASFKTCMADGGVPVSSIDDVYGRAESMLRGTNPADASSSGPTAALAKLYGHCVGPLSHAMDTYRLAARSRLVAMYGPQLDELQVQLNQQAIKLVAEYGITFP